MIRLLNNHYAQSLPYTPSPQAAGSGLCYITHIYAYFQFGVVTSSHSLQDDKIFMIAVFVMTEWYKLIYSQNKNKNGKLMLFCTWWFPSEWEKVKVPGNFYWELKSFWTKLCCIFKFTTKGTFCFDFHKFWWEKQHYWKVWGESCKQVCGV